MDSNTAGRTDIALVQCPGWGRDCPPYASASLAAYLRQKDFRVKGFDVNNALYHAVPESYHRMWDDKDYYVFWENRSRIRQMIQENPALLDRFVRDILDTGAPVIGFTTHTTSFLVSLEMAERIKKEDPRRLIVFGGPQCSRAQAGIPLSEESCIDAVCVGEGEEVLCEIARDVRENGRLTRPVAGTLMKLSDRPVQDYGDRDLIADLDSLPLPDYSDFDEFIYSKRYRQPDRMEIFDSRGCVRQCHFCSEWQFWRKYRSMSGERIFREMTQQMKKYPGVNFFYFIGSLVNGDMTALNRWTDLVLENGLDVRWAGQAIIRPDMTRETIRKLARSGCRWLGYGIESGSMKVLQGMNKYFTVDNAVQNLKDSREAGIEVQINIMFGLPGETRELFQETLDFLRRVRPYIDTVLASQSFTVVDKGTALNTRPEQFGLTGVGHHLYWQSTDGTNTYPERLRRYEEFCRLAIQLGIPETSGVLSVKPDKWFLLGDYYRHISDPARAAACYLRSFRKESANKTVLVRVAECCETLGRADRAGHYYRKALETGGTDAPLDEDVRRRLARLGPPAGVTAESALA
ncbi:MAG TPA: radical SAM protein [Elusimicrobiota bacterium]|nr:radical SAM protein [Elusimicrobiota bacterium]